MISYRNRTPVAVCIIVAMLAALVVPISGTQGSYAQSSEALTESIEVVNLPEKGEVLLGLDEDEMFERIQLKIKLKDGSEKIISDLGIGGGDIHLTNSNYAETELEYNQDEYGENGNLKEGDNKITVKYREYITVLNPDYNPETDYEDEQYMPKLVNTLETSFVVKGIVFDGYDPPLENDKAINSEVSRFGNEILFSNNELWKAPAASIRYTKKDNIKGIAKEVYNNMYLDTSGILTVENLNSEKIYSFDQVKDFQSDYILQESGRLTSIEQYYGWDNDRTERLETEVVAEDIDYCYVRPDLDGDYYTVNKNGIPFFYEQDYDWDTDQPKRVQWKMDDAKVVTIVENPLCWWEDGDVSYLTENNELKTFWIERPRDEDGEPIGEQVPKNRLLKDNIVSIMEYFAIGADGKTYSVADGRKLLDNRIIDYKATDRGVFAADDKGNLYLYTDTWKYPEGSDDGEYVMELTKAANNFDSFSNYGYYDKSGKQHGLPEYYEDDNENIVIEENTSLEWPLEEDGTVYLGSHKILTNVISVGRIEGSNTLVMGRKDGTIWLFDQDSYFYENRKRIAKPQKFSQELLNEVFDIKTTDISTLKFEYQTEVVYNGYGASYPELTIWDGEKVLTRGLDYTVTYQNNTAPGQAKMIVKGQGAYKGTKTLDFTILKQGQKPTTPQKPVKPVVKKAASITAKNFTKTYGNKPFSLGAKATSGGKLSYKSSNTKVATVSNTGRVTLKGPGKATITITAAATANYNAASKSVTITVKPKKVAGLKVKKGKKRMTVSWKRDKKVTGYQITYAQNKKFKKGKKTITISKNKTIKRTVKKLKARKTYYVKVRAYKKVGKTKIYGAYSGTKKVKVR